MTTLTPGRMAAPSRKRGTPLLVLPLVCAGLLALPGRALAIVVAEKKFDVLKMEFVTREADAMVPIEYLVPSDPSPTVTANISASDVYVDEDGNLSVNIEGTVADSLSEIFMADEDRVQGLSFKIDGNEVYFVGDLPSRAKSIPSQLPWRPYPFEIDFSEVVTASGMTAGIHTISITTTKNAANREGYCEFEIELAARPIPGAPASAGEAGSPVTVVANVLLLAEATPEDIDSAYFWLGDRQVDTNADPVLTEFPPDSGVFSASLTDDVGNAYSLTLILSNIYGLSELQDSFVGSMKIEYSDDRKAIFHMTYVEQTPYDSNLSFEANIILTAGGADETGEPLPPTTLFVQSVQSLGGNGPGDFNPFCIRAATSTDLSTYTGEVWDGASFGVEWLTINPHYYFVDNADPDKPVVFVTVKGDIRAGLTKSNIKRMPGGAVFGILLNAQGVEETRARLVVISAELTVRQAESIDAALTPVANARETSVGLFLLENDNRDSGPAQDDNADQAILGNAAQRTEDKKDLATLEISRITTQLPTGSKIVLRKLSGTGTIRLFNGTDDSHIWTSQGDGSETTDAQGDALYSALRQAIVTYRIEGVSPGPVRLQLVYKDDKSKEHVLDEALITIVKADLQGHNRATVQEARLWVYALTGIASMPERTGAETQLKANRAAHLTLVRRDLLAARPNNPTRQPVNIEADAYGVAQRKFHVLRWIRAWKRSRYIPNGYDEKAVACEYSLSFLGIYHATAIMEGHWANVRAGVIGPGTYFGFWYPDRNNPDRVTQARWKAAGATATDCITFVKQVLEAVYDSRGEAATMQRIAGRITGHWNGAKAINALQLEGWHVVGYYGVRLEAGDVAGGRAEIPLGEDAFIAAALDRANPLAIWQVTPDEGWVAKKDTDVDGNPRTGTDAQRRVAARDELAARLVPMPGT